MERPPDELADESAREHATYEKANACEEVDDVILSFHRINQEG